MGVKEPVPRSMDSATEEVVDHGHFVAARGEVHRGRPAKISVTTQDQDSHRGNGSGGSGRLRVGAT